MKINISPHVFSKFENQSFHVKFESKIYTNKSITFQKIIIKSNYQAPKEETSKLKR